MFVAQALLFGPLSIFALVVGPAALFGFMKNVRGEAMPDAGIALCLWSVPCSLVFALAVYNIRARRQPLVRICREGVEIVEVGKSLLDAAPLVPGLIRVIWSIVSTEGFRRTVTRIPWEQLEEVRVEGLPMARVLTFVASPLLTNEVASTESDFSCGEISLPEHVLIDDLARIAESVRSAANSGAVRYYPRWDVVE